MNGGGDMSKPDIIETLIHEGFQVRQNKICCPFHSDERPSLHVFTKTNTFHCFGCGEHGDSIDFVMKFRGMPFKEAIRYLSIDDYEPQQISATEATKRILIDKFKEWEKNYYNELCTLYRMIQNHKTKVTSIDDICVNAYRQEPLIEHRLDILTYGDDKAKFGLFQEVINSGYI